MPKLRGKKKKTQKQKGCLQILHLNFDLIVNLVIEILI